MQKLILFILMIFFGNCIRGMQKPVHMFVPDKTTQLKQILDTCFNTSIFYSNILGDEEKIKISELIRTGADPNVIASGSFYAEHTLLEALASYEKNYAYHRDLFNFLLKNGANPHRLRGMYKRSVLADACTRQCLWVSVILVKSGADVNQLDALNETPLFIALRKQSFSLAQYLLENGAATSIALANNFGETPLKWVDLPGYPVPGRLLVESYRKQKIQ